MKGEGKVTCSNGQTAAVHVSSHGGGFTIGKSDIVGGKGTFSDVKGIDEVFGTYVQAGASESSVKDLPGLLKKDHPDRSAYDARRSRETFLAGRLWARS